mmetsp:Transcript_7952/g.15496  ORF Transcript_7952/g.15496 Transcript_7952/m.15496 type:complete len:112 (+) Transcript_7952:165-500(+)
MALQKVFTAAWLLLSVIIIKSGLQFPFELQLEFSEKETASVTFTFGPCTAQSWIVGLLGESPAAPSATAVRPSRGPQLAATPSPSNAEQQSAKQTISSFLTRRPLPVSICV